MKNKLYLLNRSLLISVTFLLSVIACNKDGSEEAGQYVNLISPNGFILANSISDLTKIAEDHFIPNNINFSKINIFRIEYLDIPEFSVSALVYYRIDNLPVTNFGYFRKYEAYAKGATTTNVKDIIMRCVNSGGCTSCSISGTIDPVTGTQTAKCSCAECILETIIE